MSFRNQIEGFAEEAQEYVEARIEHTQLQTVEKASNTFSAILTWICIAAVIFISVILTTVLAVVALNTVLESFLLSVAIVLGFYLIVTTVLVKFRRRILTDPIKNKILGLYLNMNDNE